MDSTFGRRRLKAIQDAVQLFNYVGRQRIRLCVCLVNAEPGDAGRVRFHCPVGCHDVLLGQASSKSQTSGKWSESCTSGTSKFVTEMPS